MPVLLDILWKFPVYQVVLQGELPSILPVFVPELCHRNSNVGVSPLDMPNKSGPSRKIRVGDDRVVRLIWCSVAGQGALELGHGLPEERLQGRVAFGEGGDELVPHGAVPELVDVLGDGGDALLLGIGLEEGRDLVRHAQELLGRGLVMFDVGCLGCGHDAVNS